eukprot:m.306355 g.306355  ORF g.306355 m.306355 type:complete len:145 (+) comp41179_c0_seq1:145-579(+)
MFEMDSSSVIQEALDDADFDYDTHVSEYGYESSVQGVKGHGSYECSSCARDWSSYNAWIRIDVEEAEIVKKFEQKCQQCDTPFPPRFSNEELQRMVHYVVDRMRNGRQLSGEREANLEAPHDTSRCEKCNYGAGPFCSSAGQRY